MNAEMEQALAKRDALISRLGSIPATPTKGKPQKSADGEGGDELEDDYYSCAIKVIAGRL